MILIYLLLHSLAIKLWWLSISDRYDSTPYQSRIEDSQSDKLEFEDSAVCIGDLYAHCLTGGKEREYYELQGVRIKNARSAGESKNFTQCAPLSLFDQVPTVACGVSTHPDKVITTWAC